MGVRKLDWSKVRTPGQAHNLMVKAGLTEPMTKDGWHKPGKKKASLQAALYKYLDENPEYLEHIVMGMVHKARMGDVKILEMLWDRVDGAVVKKQSIESEVHVKRYGFAEPPRLVEAEEPNEPEEGVA
jgi:hypothetical protein